MKKCILLTHIRKMQNEDTPATACICCLLNVTARAARLSFQEAFQQLKELHVLGTTFRQIM
jgi:hypothetical protein